MQHRNPSGLFLRVALALTTVGAFVACAPAQTSTTRLTAAEVPAPAREAAPEANLPPEQLVCRTRSAAEGKTELYLDWKGTTAKGVLRRVAPSGEPYVQTVQAERYDGLIVADDTKATDLVVHAATVREQNGKHYIRLGEWKHRWAVCE